jgi:hypothetical protein
MPNESSHLHVVTPLANEAIDQAIARSLTIHQSPLADLPTLTHVVQGDPYLAEQLAALRASFEIRPAPATGLLARIRTRLVWWLLGAELQQANQVHAKIVRILDSLVVLVDQERAARRRLEESQINKDS